MLSIHCQHSLSCDYLSPSQLKSGAFLDPSTCLANPSRVTAAAASLHMMSATYAKEFPDGPAVSQSCMRPCASDALPIMGAVPGYKNAFLNCAHNCWGILWAPGAGRAMAEYITTGKTTDIDITPFDVARFGVKKSAEVRTEPYLDTIVDSTSTFVHDIFATNSKHISNAMNITSNSTLPSQPGTRGRKKGERPVGEQW